MLTERDPSLRRTAPSRARQRRPLLWRLLVWAALLTALWLILSRLIQPDRILRYFRYMGLRDREGYGQIHFESEGAFVCVGFDDGLLVGTENNISVYSLDGEQKLLLQGEIPTPVLRTGGNVGLVFSPGDSYMASLGEDGAILMEADQPGPVIDADVSFDGCAAYLTNEAGYRSVANVLNAKQEAIYRFSSRTRFLNACAVSEEGEYLAVSRLEEENGVYRSAILLLRTDLPLGDLEQDSADTVRLELGNQVVYALHFTDRDHLLAVAQDALIFFSLEGERLVELPTRSERLTDYALSAQGWLILALEQSGGKCRLLTLDAAGKALGELAVPDRIRSVSAAEDYAAVLTESCLQTFDLNLKVQDRSWDVLSASRALARADGTVLLVGNNNTKLFIP